MPCIVIDGGPPLEADCVSTRCARTVLFEWYVPEAEVCPHTCIWLSDGKRPSSAQLAVPLFIGPLLETLRPGTLQCISHAWRVRREAKRFVIMLFGNYYSWFALAGGPAPPSAPPRFALDVNVHACNAAMEEFAWSNASTCSEKPTFPVPIDGFPTSDTIPLAPDARAAAHLFITLTIINQAQEVVWAEALWFDRCSTMHSTHRIAGQGRKQIFCVMYAGGLGLHTVYRPECGIEFQLGLGC